MKNFPISVQKSSVNAMLLGITTLIGMAMNSTPAHGANLSFTGNLADPNATALFTFTADGISNVTIESRSWSGGINAAGTTIDAGGFDLNMTLFDAAGNWYDERDDINIGNLDFQFSEVLPAGTYQVAIAAFGNNSAGFGTIATPFNGAGDFENRTSAYAFDILNVNTTATNVPEPSSLIGTALAGFTVVMFRRKLSSNKK
jgi:PEP-CTERM motif